MSERERAAIFFVNNNSPRGWKRAKKTSTRSRLLIEKPARPPRVTMDHPQPSKTCRRRLGECLKGCAFKGGLLGLFERLERNLERMSKSKETRCLRNSKSGFVASLNWNNCFRSFFFFFFWKCIV